MPILKFSHEKTVFWPNSKDTSEGYSDGVVSMIYDNLIPLYFVTPKSPEAESFRVGTALCGLQSVIAISKNGCFEIREFFKDF